MSTKKGTTKKPTRKQKAVADKIMENRGISTSQAMREVGYSENTAKNPKNLTESDGWQQLMEKHIPDKDVVKVHKDLLSSTRLDHMTFPPFNEEKKDNEGKGEQITDDDIVDLLRSVDCTVRKIVHGDMVRHVYFWAADNMARDKALDKVYKLKGRYAKESAPPVAVQVNIKNVVQKVNSIFEDA